MPELGDTNPNEYDDAAFCKANLNLVDAVQQLWDAGAEVEDIQNSVKNALENAE
jgi:hypothetical protein